MWLSLMLSILGNIAPSYADPLLMPWSSSSAYTVDSIAASISSIGTNTVL
jgi:hypothetical protein